MAKKISIAGFFLTLFFAAVPASTFAATLSVLPAGGTFSVGDRVTVQVLVSSSVAVNAVSGTVTFPQMFSIESVSKGSSVLNFWVSEPNFSNASRSVQFEGVALGGFSGGTGNVVTVTLKAKQEGTGAATFSSGQILANDGQGTDVTSGFGSSNFSVIAQAVAPEPAPVAPQEVAKPAPAKPKTPAPEPTQKTEEPAIEEPTEAPQQPPTLEAPEIQLTKKFGEQAIAGVSGYPNTSVLLTFVSTAGVKIHVQDVTDDRGSFLVTVPTTLKYGTYDVSAVVIKKDLSYTDPSNKIRVQVGTIFSDTSTEMRFIIAGLIAATVMLILAVALYARRRKKNIAHVRKESAEALTIVRESFKILRKDISRKTGAKRTTKSTVSLEEVQEDLEGAEKMITKEIKDISKL
ncbi:MAG: hypothetical protein RL150_395 [Candidatus Parcubacteria bacterium]